MKAITAPALRAAEHRRAALLMDEADALLGRSFEARDAHDRYANIEVSCLLQRITAYAGVVVLATNWREAIGSAFLRGSRYIADFTGAARHEPAQNRGYIARQPAR